jgi:hypothetical protein
MSCRREPRVSSFSSSPAGRAAPCTVTQGRSCHQSCSRSGSPCRRRERYGLCGRNASIRWYRWAHTGGEQAHACGHPDARRAHLVHHRPVVDRDGDLAGAHCGGREHSDTQKTCSTAGPLCIIHAPKRDLLGRGSSVSACPYHSAYTRSCVRPMPGYPHRGGGGEGTGEGKRPRAWWPGVHEDGLPNANAHPG